jgi:hypothetical protein
MSYHLQQKLRDKVEPSRSKKSKNLVDDNWVELAIGGATTVQDTGVPYKVRDVIRLNPSHPAIATPLIYISPPLLLHT